MALARATVPAHFFLAALVAIGCEAVTLEVSSTTESETSRHPANARNFSKISHRHASQEPRHCWLSATCEAVVLGGWDSGTADRANQRAFGRTNRTQDFGRTNPIRENWQNEPNFLLSHHLIGTHVDDFVPRSAPQGAGTRNERDNSLPCIDFPVPAGSPLSFQLAPASIAFRGRPLRPPP